MSADKLKAAFAAWVKKNGIVVNGKQELQGIFDHFLKTQVLPRAQAAGGQVLGGGGTWDEVPDAHDTHMVNDGSTVQIADVDHDANGPYVDDWQQLLRDRAKAAIGPNGQLLDDFDQEFELGQQKTADAQAVAPPANTNPPSSITAILGGQAQVSANQPPIEVARWVGDDTEATNVTINVGPVSPQNTFANTNYSYRNYARVQFGTRGFLLPVEVDLGQGCQFTVSGSMVTVALAVDPNPNATFNQSAQLVGMMSFRQANRTAPITRTRYIDLLTGSEDVLVPPFAKRVTFYVINITANATFDFLDSQSNVAGIYTLAAGTQSATLVLPGDCVAVQVNVSAQSSVRMVFELAL